MELDSRPGSSGDPQVFDLHLAKERAFTDYVGMLMCIVALSMMFGGLFYGYATLRVRSTAWPPDGLPDLPILLPGFNTVVLLLSSLCLQGSMAWLKKDHSKRSFQCLVGANVFGVGFLVLQWVLWSQLYDQGLHWSSKAYGSVFYGFTFLHAVHVLVGIVLLLRLIPRHLKGEFTARRHLSIRLIAMYWHFVDVIWVAMYLSIFVI